MELGDVGQEAGLELLRQRLELAAPSARRGGRGVAVMAVRVHPPMTEEPAPAGPALEEQVRRRLRSCLRLVDEVVAIERHHYVVLLERLDDGPFAVHAADRIVSEIRRPFRVDGEDVALVASVGVSLYPDDGEQLDDLVRCANTAAEAAALSGGNLFGFGSGAANEAATRRVAIERAVVGALERNELSLAFQPQVDTRDGTIAGIEALLRWHNDKLGDVAPSEFVPILEATGEIDRVGAWVMRRACTEAASWARADRPSRVGVNVSAHQMRGGTLATIVDRALSETGLAPSLLELELTESVLVENPESTRALLETLRRRGVRVAVDDFGTGYASLAYVRQIPMDCLKIDRQFVRGLPVNNENAAITSAIVALARSLRIEIVAEGVETEAEEEFLHSLDCYVVQGFRHARPMSVDQLVAWKRERPWA